VVLVPNLFWRAGAPEVFSAAGFADPKIRDRIMGLITQTLPVAMKDAATWLDALGAMGEVKDKNRISTTGYCMGGGLAVHSAVAFPDRVAAALSFHGGGFLTSPEAPAALAKVKARIYCAIAETDQRHTPEVTRALEAALTQAKVPHQLELYAGVAHGFAVPDHSVYDRAAAEKHWERTAAWLKETYA
jgi:carboxymethylenebutenolidase